eukprot:GEZU01003044.1.p1 GENE.GEZU01003044.1~~GEZU01003044.1.p1  ORF type:complete len:389 (+),score=137.51 GEZU01003044.1:121-1287(+)
MQWAKIKNFDIYPKTIEDFREKTVIGAAISILSITIITFLVISELSYFLSYERVDELYVDTKGDGKIPIYLNISFPSVSCDALSLDMMDVTGEHQINVEHTVFKTKLDREGRIITESIQRMERETRKPEAEMSEEDKKLAVALEKYKNRGADYCGSCYGAESDDQKCCNTCDDIRNAYRRKGWAFTPTDQIEQCAQETIERRFKAAKKEGCNLYGFILVNKVAGNFHFAPGLSFNQASRHVHDYMPFEIEQFNVSHVIHRLGFGEDYPGLKNPLDGASKIIEEGSGLYQYFIKVVPTIYEFADGRKLETNQYSVTESFRPKKGSSQQLVPSVFFMYDLSPIMVHIREKRKSFIHFLTSLCAIVGGVLTVAGLVDTILYNALRGMKKKM